MTELPQTKEQFLEQIKQLEEDAFDSLDNEEFRTVMAETDKLIAYAKEKGWM